MMAVRQDSPEQSRRSWAGARSRRGHDDDKPTISATRRFLLISRNVYDRAQKRGFVGGDPLEDLSEAIRQVDEEYTTDIMGLLSLSDPAELAEQFRDLFAGYGLGKRNLDQLLEKNRAALEKLARVNRSQANGTAERESLLRSAANEAMQNLQAMAETAKKIEQRAHLPGSPTQAVLDLLSGLSSLAESAVDFAGNGGRSGADRDADRARQRRGGLEIHGAVIKAYQGMGPGELAEAPTEALKGLSPDSASRLEAAFGMVSIRDMADNQLVEQAAGIVTLADAEMAGSGGAGSRPSRGSLTEMAEAPVSRLEGITPRQARVLRETLHTRTIRDLAGNRFFKVARAIVALADLHADQRH